VRSAAQWRKLLAEVDQAGLCSHPVRLRGLTLDRSSGELVEGDLLVACKDRRAALCPSCSRIYQADAWQLVAAGIRGGKGVSPSVLAHPQLFVTLTAPSFGPVHRSGVSGGAPRPCRPRRRAGRCPHGKSLSCIRRHGADDPVVGEPLCPACFDYRGAVLWNAHVSALWARTVHRLYREVARSAGLSTRALRAVARLSYIKVVEFQGRGLVHLHVVVRADGGAGPSEPPPPWLDAAALRTAVGRAVAGAAVPVPDVGETALRRARWGAQVDVRVLLAADDSDATAIAAYVAKYATKTADGTTWLAHRIRSRAEIERLVLRPHILSMVKAAWALGRRRDLAPLRLRDHAHTLGYPGQFSSKSVAFSTTFTALRRARTDYVRAEREGDVDYDGEWRYAGRGYGDPEADLLAAALLGARLEGSRRVPERSRSTSREGSRTP
jgi:hypothetical protein